MEEDEGGMEAGVGSGAVGASASLGISEDKLDVEGAETDGVKAGGSTVSGFPFPSLLSFSPSFSGFKEATGVAPFPSLLSISPSFSGFKGTAGVAREAGEMTPSAFFSTSAGGVAEMAGGTTVAFLAAADVSLERRVGDALEVIPPAALGTWPEIGFWILPPLFLFFFLPFAMGVCAYLVCLLVVGGVGVWGVRNGGEM